MMTSATTHTVEEAHNTSPILNLIKGPSEEVVRRLNEVINNKPLPKQTEKIRNVVFTTADGVAHTMRILSMEYIREDGCWEFVGDEIDNNGNVLTLKTKMHNGVQKPALIFVTVRYFFYCPNGCCGNWIEGYPKTPKRKTLVEDEIE